MADQKIASFNKGPDPICSNTKLPKENTAKTGNDGPPQPAMRCKESEQRILSRQNAMNSFRGQTPTHLATSKPVLSAIAPASSAEAIPVKSDVRPVSVYAKFSKGRSDVFHRIKSMDQLRADIRARYKDEGEILLCGGANEINDMSELMKAWPNCDGNFRVVFRQKKPDYRSISEAAKPPKQNNEKTGNDALPPPVVHCKTPEESMPGQQDAMGLPPIQMTHPTSGNPVLNAIAPASSAEAIRARSDMRPVSVYVKFSKGRSDVFHKIKNMDQLRAEIRARYKDEGEILLWGGACKVNDMSELMKAWPNCDGNFRVVFRKIET